MVWATMLAASEFVSSSSSKTVRLLARLGMARICTIPCRIARGKSDLGFQNDTIPAKLSNENVLVNAGRFFIVQNMVHVGIGYDTHKLVEGRKLILGGVEIPHTKGLDGHSDADALMHAICDAIFGAIGAKDIGYFFPNTDPRWKNKPSRIFLEEAARQVVERKGKIVNVDATVIAKEPKLLPHIDAMKKCIAIALGVTERQIGVKATTHENVGSFGRGEGIAAVAVASVDLPEKVTGGK